MNDAQRRAIKNEIGNLEDDLYRFQMQQKAMPNWRSGNSVPIQDIIDNLRSSIAELKEGL